MGADGAIPNLEPSVAPAGDAAGDAASQKGMQCHGFLPEGGLRQYCHVSEKMYVLGCVDTSTTLVTDFCLSADVIPPSDGA